MKKIFTLFYIMSIFPVLSCTNNFWPYDLENKKSTIEFTAEDLQFKGMAFPRTSFVTVIPKGSSVTIPNDKLTHIGDVFWEKRTITLTHYAIGRYEVTQQLYQAVMGKNPYPDAENCYGNEHQELRPVQGVTLWQALQFCNKLSELCGLEPVYTIASKTSFTWDFSKSGYRLPTEAEWEFAARGAGRTIQDWNYKYSGSDNYKKVAWTSENSAGPTDDDVICKTHEVGLKQPNGLGIYDMSGNVAEWCTDWYRSITEGNDFSHGNAVKDSGEVTNPCMEKGTYDNHPLRGGDYCENAGNALNNQRNPFGPTLTPADGKTWQGIRLVRRF